MHFCIIIRTEKLLLQEATKTPKRLSDSSDRRLAKKQRRESNTSNSNRVGSVSPTLNHSTPARKTGSLLNRPANVVRPVSYIDICLIVIIKD